MCIKLSWYYETSRVAKIRPSEVTGLNHPLEFSSKIATENLWIRVTKLLKKKLKKLQGKETFWNRGLGDTLKAG